MPDLPSHPDTGASPGPELGSGSRRSRWTTITGIAVGLLVLAVFVVLHLKGIHP